MALETAARSGAPGRPSTAPAGGFISYSREESAPLAGELQTALERFAKPWYRLRAVRVFRDDASMSANADLRGSIESALAQSGWFILLASPKAAHSPWVESEIRWWLDHRTADRIMLVQARGEIRWDSRGNAFDPDRSSAIPPILHRAYEHEPRWIDLCWYAEPGSLGKGDPRFVERVADLAAPLHGRERADLVGENVRQHRRAVRLARWGVAALVVLLVAALVATVLAVLQRQAANDQRDKAVRQNVISVARQLAATAVNLADSDLQQASLIAVHAYRLHRDPQTAAALYATAAASPHLVGFLDAGSTVTATAGTPDGAFVVGGTEAGDVWRWDRVTGERERIGQLDRPVGRVLVSDDGRVVAASSAQAYDDEPGPADAFVWRDGETSPTDKEIVAMSPGGEATVQVVSSDGAKATILIVDATSVVQQLRLPFSLGSDKAGLPSPSRLVLAGSAYGELAVYDLPSGRQVVHGQANTGAHAAISSLDSTGSFVTVDNGARVIEVWAVTDVPPGELESEPFGFGASAVPVPVAIALSPGGQQIATSVDGKIWVSQVAEGALATPPPPELLTGSGPAADGTLAFLSQRLLVSGSGSAVSVWDLAQESRLGPLLHVRHPLTCSGCGPAEVLADPSGSRAVVYGEDHSDVVFADFARGTSSSWSQYGGGPLWRLANTYGVWLDDDRFLAWDDVNAIASVWTGPALDQLAARWVVPALKRPPLSDSPAHAVLVATGGGGARLLDSLGRVLSFDVDARSVEEVGAPLPFVQPAASEDESDVTPDAIGLDQSGDRAWALTLTGDDPFEPTHTQLQIHDLVSGRVLLDERLDGVFYEASLAANTMTLWGGDRAVTAIDVRTGRHKTLPLRIGFSSAWSRTGSFVTSEQNGTVSLYDTDLGVSVGTFDVPTEAYAFTEFGFSASDDVLVVATAASDETGRGSVRSLRLGYDAWQAIDCAAAGRDLTADEWRALTNLAVPTDMTCSR